MLEIALIFHFLGANCKIQVKLLDWVPRNYTLSLEDRGIEYNDPCVSFPIQDVL